MNICCFFLFSYRLNFGYVIYFWKAVCCSSNEENVKNRLSYCLTTKKSKSAFFWKKIRRWNLVTFSRKWEFIIEFPYSSTNKECAQSHLSFFHIDGNFSKNSQFLRKRLPKMADIDLEPSCKQPKVLETLRELWVMTWIRVSHRRLIISFLHLHYWLIRYII